MSSSQRTKLILHLSDLRVGDTFRVDERADAIIGALTAKSAPQKRFDFIAVTGDIKDQTADPTTAYEKAALFLTRLESSLLRESDRARVLIVPGNHDWRKDSDFLFYNRFTQWWYGQSPIAHCLKSTDDDGKAPVAYLIDHRQDDVVFLLMNSYWENTQAKDRLVSGEVCESQRQAFDIQLESVFRDLGERPPMLALMHQQLIPTRDYAPNKRKLIFSKDCPATVEWLLKHQTVIVFHGPPAGYALLRTDEVHAAHPELRTELMVLGASACRADETNQEEDQFQEILVNLKPRRFLESTIERTEYHLKGGAWVQLPGTFTSHETFSNFQKGLVEAEQFTCEQIHEDMRHPLRSEPAEEWFWKHYNAAWNECNPHELDAGETPLQRKEKFLDLLVGKLKEYNSDKAIFELLPFQLDAIYTYAAIFFSNEDIEKAAVREFDTKPWQSWLRFNDIADYAIWNHLDWANWIIADELRAWVIESSPKCVGIVDLGYGLLRTIDAIGRNIPDIPEEQRYLGIDVSSNLLQSATQMLREMINPGQFFINEKTKPFDGIGDYFLKFAGRKFWRRDNNLVPLLKTGGFNVFVCVYAMHHCSNSFRVRKSLIDGSFFKFIDHKARLGADHLGKQLGSQILERVSAGLRTEFIRKLVLLSGEQHVDDFQPDGRTRDPRPQVLSSIDRVLQLAFPNSQSDVYKMVFDTMQDGGLLCIADPNGMSRTFNRQQIFRNPAIAIAHFSDWTDAVSMVADAGFEKIRVFRQIRMNSLQVRRVAIPEQTIAAIVAKKRDSAFASNAQAFHESILPEGFEQFRSEFEMPAETVDILEILDQHMGYILIAEKPKKV